VRRGRVSETWRHQDRYEKRYRALYPWLWLAGLLKGNMPALDARIEAANAERIRALGVRAPRPLGTTSRWRLTALGVVHESTVALEPLPGDPVDALLSGRAGRSLESGERLRLARAIGDAAGRLHAARIFHRDLYLCHFLWDGAQASLLDAARAAPTRLFAARRRVKDLGALLASALSSGARGDELRAFARAYRAQGAPLGRSLLDATRARAERMMARVRAGS